jgi:hypothetical protein
MRFSTFITQNSMELHQGYNLYVDFCEKWNIEPKSKMQFAYFVYNSQ